MGGKGKRHELEVENGKIARRRVHDHGAIFALFSRRTWRRKGSSKARPVSHIFAVTNIPGCFFLPLTKTTTTASAHTLPPRRGTLFDLHQRCR